jgi:hypothetical protein
LAGVRARFARQKRLRDDEGEHPVAEELKPLVVWGAPTYAGVRQRSLDQGTVGERIAETALEIGDRFGATGRHGAAPIQRLAGCGAVSNRRRSY